MAFLDDVKKAMPYLSREWSQEQPVASPPVEKPASRTTAGIGKDDEKARGLSDPQLIIKMQQLALPAGSASQAGGDMSTMQTAMQPPNNWGGGIK